MSETGKTTAGGKRAGAGRKPQGAVSKTVNYNARISSETLNALKAEAATTASGSVATLAGYLIETGLEERRRKKDRDASTKALAFLISELTDAVAVTRASEKFNWHDDAFIFEALRVAIKKFLPSLKPAGEATSLIEQMPALKGTTIWGPLSNAKARGEWASDQVLRALMLSEPEQLGSLPDGLPGRLAKLIRATTYGFHDARRDLKLTGLLLEDRK